MKISDITDETIKAHCGITEAPNGLLEVYKSAAIAEICGFTGLTTEELDEYGTPIEVNVNANVSCELDGDKIGETSYRYNQRQMAYTNGY